MLNHTNTEPISLEKFRLLLHEILPRNQFYARKFQHLSLDPKQFQTLEDLTVLPFTYKSELTRDQIEFPPYGSIHTYPRSTYSRLHQTSGTTSGIPLKWLDTTESWNWLLNCWQIGFSSLGLTSDDVLFFPFSFGPFLGFWTAFEAASRSGYLCIPGGGMSSTSRIHFLLEHRATVLCCTPTYAFHLAEIAIQENIALHSSPVRALILAGEPGGCIPSIRERLENTWGARVFDHYGMTEMGPVAIESFDSPQEMVLFGSEYIAEVIDLKTGRSVQPGEVGELVLTNLGRFGSPLIRYRTGDLVKLGSTQSSSHSRFHPDWQRFPGGILGRTDDMIYLRGNNVYPSALESIIRKFPEVAEFRFLVDQREALTDLLIQIEPKPQANGESLKEKISQEIRDTLLFRVEVELMAENTLPRYEFKTKHFFRLEEKR